MKHSSCIFSYLFFCFRMMIEVMPFLHLMVNKIEYVLKHKGVNDQK